MHISTDFVFDGLNSLPYKPHSDPAPQSVYGRSKLAGEKAALALPNNLVVRTAWVYSRHGSNFVKAMLRLMDDRGRVGECYNIGGGAELPNLDVVDVLCKTLDDLFTGNSDLKKRFPDAPAASGKPTSSLKTFVNDRPGHDRRYAIDESKAVRELGYSPSRSFAEGFAETVNWYLANEPWWRSVMDGSYRDWVDLNYERRSV